MDSKVERLKELGHELDVFETMNSRRFIVMCTCGYGKWQQAPSEGRAGRPTVTRATLQEAVRTAEWHADQVLKAADLEARRNGRVLPRAVARSL